VSFVVVVAVVAVAVTVMATTNWDVISREA
jgi:hypothetical protein